MKKDVLISIIIPVYRKTEMFLNNFRHNWHFIKDYEVIVVDDASGEHLQEKLKNYSKIYCLVNEQNVGFGPSMNIGIKKAVGYYLLFLNSDVLLKDSSFVYATEILNKDKSLFAVSFAQEEDDKIVGKNRLFWRNGLCQHSSTEDMKSDFSAWAEGGACMVRAKYIKELKGFDERFSPFYGEDIDLSLQALKRGWKVWFESSIRVVHKHESTIGAYYNSTYIESVALRNQVLYSWKNSSLFQKLSMIVFVPYYLFFYIKQKKIHLLKAYIEGWFVAVCHFSVYLFL